MPYYNGDNISMKYMPIIMSLMDLPFQQENQHKVKSDNQRGVSITMGTNAIVFKKSIL